MRKKSLELPHFKHTNSNQWVCEKIAYYLLSCVQKSFFFFRILSPDGKNYQYFISITGTMALILHGN